MSAASALASIAVGVCVERSKSASPWADFEHGGRDKIAAMPGHEVYKLTPEQMAAWKKAAEPLKAKWASQVKDADVVFARLEAALKQHGAAAE